MKGGKYATIYVGCLAIGAALLAGCSTHVGYIGHAINTEVELSGNNFRVVESVTGRATANYFLGIGGPTQNVMDKARRDMIQRANLIGSSRAIVNVTTDVRHVWFLFWLRKTAFVSGEVVEFTSE